MNRKFPAQPESYWLETAETQKFPALQENIHVDVIVAGGGIAGITTAYLLAAKGYEVALCEAQTLFNGTTGNTTAKLTAQHGLIYNKLINRYGKETAGLYYQANMEAIALIKKWVEKYNIDCDLEEQDAFVYTQSQQHREEIEKEAATYQKLGIEGGMLSDLPLDIEIDAAVQMRNQAQFHPVKYLKGLLKAFEEMGGKVYEHTMITDVDTKNHTICYTDTGREVACEHVVFATHYPTYEVDKFFPKNLEPESSYALALKVEREFPDGMYINIEEPKRTMRSLTKNGEQYILVGGESHPTGDGKSTEQRYHDILTFADTHFGVEKVINRWSSHDLITPDRIPFAGELSEEDQNIYVITGFSKWGLTNATIGAELITDFISGESNPYEQLFSLKRTVHSLEQDATSSQDTKQDKRSSPVHDPAELNHRQGAEVKVDGEKVGAYRDEEGNLHLLDLACTHMGCDVKWNDGDATWDCPCHGSRFYATGEVAEGPAMKALKKKG